MRISGQSNVPPPADFATDPATVGQWGVQDACDACAPAPQEAPPPAFMDCPPAMEDMAPPSATDPECLPTVAAQLLEYSLNCPPEAAGPMAEMMMPETVAPQPYTPDPGPMAPPAYQPPAYQPPAYEPPAVAAGGVAAGAVAQQGLWIVDKSVRSDAELFSARGGLNGQNRGPGPGIYATRATQVTAGAAFAAGAATPGGGAAVVAGGVAAQASLVEVYDRGRLSSFVTPGLSTLGGGITRGGGLDVVAPGTVPTSAAFLVAGLIPPSP